MPIGAFRLNSLGKFTVTAAAQVIRSKKGVTAVGNAQISTAQSKFGGSSALFDGSGDYLRVIQAENLSSNFTIEFWVRFNNVTDAYQFPLVYGASQSGGLSFYMQTSTFRLDNFNVGNISAGTLVANTWYHFAAVRNGSTVTLYKDGISQGTASWTTTFGNSNGLYIGGRSLNDYWHNGYIDELRVSNTARYTANFTPSTTPFVNDDNTLLLLHMDGSNASTYFEDDNGQRNSNGLVAVGNTNISATQSKFGGTSAYLDGTGDYIRTPIQGRSFNISGNFTYECWFYFTAHDAYAGIFGSCDPGDGGSRTDWQVLFNNTANSLALEGPGVWSTSATALATSTWHHIALVRNGSAVTLYVNGSSYLTATNSAEVTGLYDFCVGAERHQGRFTAGYVDEIRVSNTARYTANFTPPTAAFTADSNTLFLLHADSNFTDSSGNNRRVEQIGTVAISSAQSKFGGSSIALNQSNSYIRVPSNPGMSITGNFTIEGWVYYTGHASYAGLFSMSNWGSAAQTGTQFLFNSTTNNILVECSPTNFTTTNTLTANTWNHMALVRSGSTVTLYVNGTSWGTLTSTRAIPSGLEFLVGVERTYANCTTGYFDEVRVSNVARYTGSFTPSTTPFTNDANTLLLMHNDGTVGSTVLLDDNGVRNRKSIRAVGNAQISTAQSKFGGTSLLCDGTGDYLRISPNTDFIFGTNDYTVEFWIRMSSQTLSGIFDTRLSSNDAAICLIYTGSAIQFYSQGSGRITGSALANSTWYHVAVVRSGNDHKLYVNGTQSGSTWTNSNNITNVATTVTLGAVSDAGGGNYTLPAYIDELRVSNSARYTANFTPSTTPFVNDANTLLLIHMDGTNASTVFVDDNGVVPYTPS